MAAFALGILSLYPLAAETRKEPGQSAPTGKVTVSKIRFIIDDAVWNWTEEGCLADSGEQGTGKDALSRLAPGAFIPLLEFPPGTITDDKDLAAQCARAAWRINDSGYVYSASVTVVPPRKNPAERTIVVELASGFLYRFGGGNAWAMFGKEGLGGERAGYRLWAGWNRLGAEYRRSGFGTLPLTVRSSGTWFGPGEATGYEKTGRFDGRLGAGWLFGPGLEAGMDASLTVPDFAGMPGSGGKAGGADASIALVPRVESRLPVFNLTRVAGEPAILTCRAETAWYPTGLCATAEGTVAFRMLLARNLEAAAQTGAGTSLSDIPSFARFDLYGDETRAVRSGWAEGGLIALSFVYLSAELRRHIVAFKVGPGFPARLSAFVFGDLAAVNVAVNVTATGDGAAQGTGPEPGPAFRDAVGAGLRLSFDNPVFAYFTATWGINRLGDSRFIFSASGGY